MTRRHRSGCARVAASHMSPTASMSRLSMRSRSRPTPERSFVGAGGGAVSVRRRLRR